MIYCDANFIVAAVAHVTKEDRTEMVERYLRGKGPFLVSPLAVYETRKHLIGLGESLGLACLDELLKEKLELLPPEWDAAIRQALKLAATYREKLEVDSADTLHVGWALACGASVFASFDRDKGPRALAFCSGLQVFPNMNQRDFSERKRLKG